MPRTPATSIYENPNPTLSTGLLYIPRVEDVREMIRTAACQLVLRLYHFVVLYFLVSGDLAKQYITRVWSTV